MVAPTIDNVISIASARSATISYGRGRNVTAESAGVINDCRDIALKRIVELLAGTFDKIEDELFNLAERASDRETQNLYLDARAQSQNKRGAIEAAFKKQFLSFFERKVAGEDNTDPESRVEYGSMELTLVDDAELEERLAVADIAQRMSDTCDGELRALSQRMGFLLSEPELRDDANPIAPDTIIKALKVACDQMTGGYRTKLTVLRMVEQHIAKDMLAVYHDINSHLVAHRILPQIRPAYRKAQDRPSQRAPDAMAITPEKAPSAGNAHNHVRESSSAAANVFQALQQLLAGGDLFENSHRSGSASPPMHGINTGSFAPPPPASSNDTASAAADAMLQIATGESRLDNPGLLSALTQIQLRQASDAVYNGGPATPGNLVSGQMPASVINILHGIRSPDVAETCSAIDAMTIDIVAMLFDYVFDDKTIPEGIKGLIARLQIPVLKVALLDRSFFSRKTHPARRLLDTLAGASVCFGGVADRRDPLYQMIETVVDRVHTEFETDIQIFAETLIDFERFLGQREAAASQFIEQSARAVHEREKREMARLIAQDEMYKRITFGALPAPVESILAGPWTRVLERVYLREGGRLSGFAQALETVDDLIWSVSPKSNAEERKRLVSMLPHLLRNLQHGMEIAAVEPEDRSRFFAILVDCHAAAVKAGLRGESVITLLPDAHADNSTTPLFLKLTTEEKAREAEWKSTTRTGVARILFNEHGVEIEEIGAHMNAADLPQSVPGANTPPAMVSPTSSQYPRRRLGPVDIDNRELPIVDLKRGTWVEFLHGGGRCTRAKLSWISPLKGVYLFTNPGATEALSVTPDALKVQFRRGDARLIEESSLIDRAVDRMVNSLSEAARP